MSRRNLTLAGERRRLVYCQLAGLLLICLLPRLVISGADCLLTSILTDTQQQLTPTSNSSQLQYYASNSQQQQQLQDRILILKPSFNSPSSHKKSSKEFKIFEESITVFVKENTPIGSKVADVRLTALSPEYASAQTLYTIIGDEKQFKLLDRDQNNKVELINDIIFDFESPVKTYHVDVRATSSYFKYDIKYEITVTDENDNKPQLDDFAIIFNNYKNNFPLGPIGRVPAFDADVNDQLRYSVLAGNSAQLVAVNQTNGDIQLNPLINGNVPMRALITVSVSDGQNDAVAQMILSINLVTETMLQNSIVLRLDGIGREEFLNKKYDIFVNTMAKILGSGINYHHANIVVFDVEESNLSLASPNGNNNNTIVSLNVSFSARAIDGNDVESYLTSQYIEERVYMSRAYLTKVLDVQVSPFQDNLCLHEPCASYQECQATYKFDKASRSFITTRSMIFRPIRASQSYICTCPPTFTGMKHKSECNLQINQCLSSPCQNEGLCHMHELGFTCQCKPGFVGSRCEHSFANSTCQDLLSTQLDSNSQQVDPSPSSINSLPSGSSSTKQQGLSCGGKSKCTNKNKPYFDGDGKTGHLGTSTAGFVCAGCPNPQWSSELCQLKARSFKKDSYVTLPSLRRRHKFHLALKFATFQSDALLLYNGRYNDKYDFIALEIINSSLRFSYSLGSSTTSVTLPHVFVSNGDWHTVTIDYRDRNVTLLINECDPIIDEALARSDNSHKRCSISAHPDSSVPDKTLDLTSPMQLGSLLPLEQQQLDQAATQSYPVSSPGFIGCMSDLHLDHKLVDLYNTIHESGTQPGCPEKRNFCQQHSCNGHPCTDTWGAARCSCGDDNVGKSCEISLSQEKIRRFNGNSYLAFNPIESIVKPIWLVSMHFRTNNKNGVLMKVSLDTEQCVVFELVSEGHLKLSHRGQNMTFTKQSLSDGEWHFIELIWSSDHSQLQVDYNPNLSVQSDEMGSIAGSVIKSVTIGALQTARSSSQPATLPDGSLQPPADTPPSIIPPELSPYVFSAGPPPLPTDSSQSFVGCIFGVNVSDNADQWLAPQDERNVERGCQIADACDTPSACPPNSQCVRRGISQRKCLCAPGFVGDRCLPICELSPCQGDNSRCVPPVPQFSGPQLISGSQPSALQLQSNDPTTSLSLFNPQFQQQAPSDLTASPDYQCECEPFRSGRNCENILQSRCPSNWWGKPQPGSNSSICGPCNCDESRGFDGDCDKLTGQCLCKLDHYQPAGADSCLPCDCYADGSLRSRSCHQKTGQCKCRPGVVGRRCDTCASPYAQVTVRGCEVVYDGCPKTFSDGIWWEKTPLDKTARQQCPASTSTGEALRFCHKTEGWQKANLFDCVSNLFLDLLEQFRVFEERKFPMTSSLAIKIAANLRQALNETASNPQLELYGSDMLISFRLIHYLVQHESQQSGLNLTHRQDRSYIRNIVESVSYIIDPAHAENWPEITARSPNGGPEYLLKLLDLYGRVIIESQSDTYPQPFEVNTKFLTFGLDILSTSGDSQAGWSPATSRQASNSGSFGSPPYATELPASPMDAANDIFASDNQHPQQLHPSNVDQSSATLVIPKASLKFGSATAAEQSTSVDVDTTTKILIPLKTLRVKPISPDSIMMQSPSYGYQAAAKSRAKRDELVLPDMKFTRQLPALVTYSIFRSIGALLPSNMDNTVHHRLGASVSPNAPVVWLTVRPANSTEFLSRNLQPRIQYTLKVLEPQGKMRPQCAIWDFVGSPSQQSSVGGISSKNAVNITSSPIKQIGKFTTKGCELKGIQHNSRSRHKYDYVNCSCDHLGAVTVLMDNANYDYLIGDEQATLKDYSLIGALCVSLVIMLANYIVLAHVRGHSIKSNSNSINKNIILILIIIELLLLYGVASRQSLTSQREYQCKLMAVFLHYFSVSLFFWLFVNAIHFYRMLTELRDINHGPMKFYRIIGYVVPGFFVSIAVGLRIEQFGNHLFCWLSTQEPIIWSMFGPICAISMATFTLFLLALCKSLPVKEDPSGAELLKNHMVINLIKIPLIAFYWIIALYVVNETFYLDWALFFPLLAIVKSLGLIVLLCFVDKHIRYNLYVSWLRFRGQEAPFLEEQPASAFPSSQWVHNTNQPYYFNGGIESSQKDYGLQFGLNSAASYNSTGALHGHAHQVTTPGFQSSYGGDDIFQQDVLGLSAASTTSRSTATGTSSSVYQYQRRKQDLENNNGYGQTSGRGRSKHRRRSKNKSSSHHKHHHHKHHHHKEHHHHHHHRSHRHHAAEAEHYQASGSLENGHYATERRSSRHNHKRDAQRHHDNELLASSHSSDGEDASFIPKNNNNINNQADQQGDIKQQQDTVDAEKQQQTVPMEVATASTSSSKTQDSKEDEKKAN